VSEPASVIFSTPAMTAVFSGEAWLRAMLRFEVALARAESRAGIIPRAAAEQIVQASAADGLDADALLRETASAGTPAIPLTKWLSGRLDEGARRYVHFGATSQDTIDTASVLQWRDGLGLLERGLLELAASCATLAERYRFTVMAGRTVMQQALPITFGLKAARWLALVVRQVERLRDVGTRVLLIQFGGAAGTLASLGGGGLRVAELLADELNLGVPDLPWHAERDRVAELAAALGVVAGAMAKVANDLLLLGQTEVGEASEGAAPGKGGSSAMPHKRNPVDAWTAISAARLAIAQVPTLLNGMVQENERAAGNWQAEWPALPDLFRHTAGAVSRLGSAMSTLEVHPERMRENLQQTRGLLMAESLSTALASLLGREAAHALVQRLIANLADGEALASATKAEPQIAAVLSADAVDRALDPAGYLGSTNALIDRALRRYQGLLAAGFIPSP
jgi:3-carboxy-cis,cis-muconate cycloisomerase